MAAINPHYESSDSHSDSSPERKQEIHENGHEVNIAGAETWEEDSSHHLHRGLKARQITMIAIGGAIGTGLIIGTLVCPNVTSIAKAVS